MPREPPRVNVNDLLPPDEEIATTNLKWRKLFEKYSAPEMNTDDEGLSIADALKQYMTLASDESDGHISEAEEDKAPESDSSVDYDDVKDQLATALKEKTKNWEENGLAEILNDVKFELSNDFVENWVKNNDSTKKLARERQTRITKQDGNSTVDWNCKSNVTFLNDNKEKSMSTTTSTNYDVSRSNSRIVIHQVEKTTMTTVVAPIQSNGTSHAALGSLPFPNFNAVPELAAIDPVQGFKMPMQPKQLKDLNLAGLKHVLLPLDDAETIEQRKNERTCEKGFHEAKVPTDEKKKSKTKKTVSFKAFPKSSKKAVTKSKEKQNYRNGVENNSYSSSDEDVCGIASHARKTSKSSTKISARASRCIKDSSSSDSDYGSSQPENQRFRPTTKSQPEADASSQTGTNKRINHNPSAANRTRDSRKDCKEKYIMPADFQKFLNVEGQRHYKIDGIVIYEPEKIVPNLPATQRKQVKMRDLNLDAVKSQAKRKRFENFSKLIHPNSTLVYYMTESEDERPAASVSRSVDEESESEEDDPLCTFSRLIVYEFTHC